MERVRVMGEETRGSGSTLLTFAALRRQYGLGDRTLKREAAAGSFPVYRAGTAWPRVRRSEFEAWLDSTRVEYASTSAQPIPGDP